MRVVFWGTYDTGKPRTRILLQGLRENGVEVIECHTDIWSQVEDKSRVASRWQQLGYLLRLLAAYPRLIWRYLRLPRHDAVVVGYPGQLDIWILCAFARLRRTPLVFDLVQSAYLSLVHVRQKHSPDSLKARILKTIERHAISCAQRTIFLSQYAVSDLQNLLRFDARAAGAVPIGVEPQHFPALAAKAFPDPEQRPIEVLFYGSFHALHGIDTIISAAQKALDLPIHWTLIGEGAEAEKLRIRLQSTPLPKLTWIPWVSYETLIGQLQQCDIALGLIGRSDHSGWVVPNKVSQVLFAGVPLITADTPATRELVGGPRDDLLLITPGNADALLQAIQAMRKTLSTTPPPDRRHQDLVEQLMPKTIGERFRREIEQAMYDKTS